MDPRIFPTSNKTQAQHMASPPYDQGPYNLVGVPPFSPPGPPVYTQLIPVGQHPQLRAQHHPINHPMLNGGYSAPTTPSSCSRSTNNTIAGCPPSTLSPNPQPQYNPPLRAPDHPSNYLLQNSGYGLSQGAGVAASQTRVPLRANPLATVLDTHFNNNGVDTQDVGVAAGQPPFAPSAGPSRPQLDRHFNTFHHGLGRIHDVTGQAPNQGLSQQPLAAPNPKSVLSRQGLRQHRYDRPGSEWETPYIHREVNKALAAKRSMDSITPRIARVLTINLRREAEKRGAQGERGIVLTKQSIYNKFKRDKKNPRALTTEEEEVVRDLEEEADQAPAEEHKT